MARVELIGPKELLRKVRPILFDLGQEARRAVEKDFPDQPITCTRSCAYCCYQKIVVNAFEGALIFTELYSKGLWKQPLIDKLTWADAAQTESTHAHWNSQMIPCPFLKVKSEGRGECTVYGVRPIACAMTLSIKGDPKSCATVYGDGQMQVTMVTSTTIKILEIKAALQGGLGDGDKVWGFTLPGAVLYAAAVLRGLPTPPVHRIPWADVITEVGPVDSEAKAKHVSDVFDAVATKRLGDEEDQPPPRTLTP